MEREAIEEWLSWRVHDEVLLADGFDEAFIGITEREKMPPVALYDRMKCVYILMERDGMNLEDAIEFFEFNTLCSWVGEMTPAYATLVAEEEINVATH